jgi:hypothetical protein
VAVSVVAFTNVVGCGAPIQSTTDVLTKFVPVTVIVNGAEPALTVPGERFVIVGSGFAVLEIVKVAEFDVPPPGVGLVTVTVGEPAPAISAAVIAAVSCVALLNVVARGELLKFTTDEETKFVPVTTNENAAPPATAEFGASDVTVGSGLLTELTAKLTEFDAPPPGVGFVTTTAGVPALATSVARIVAVTCVEFTTTVALFAPPKLTIAPLTKFVPFTVSTNDAEPTAVPLGDNELTVGTGLLAASTTSVRIADVLPAKFASPRRTPR